MDKADQVTAARAVSPEGEISRESAREVPYIVGLGASAGGLEALQQFFSTMNADSGMAFVIVQHLSPDYKSMMVELIAKTTRMKVRRITDGLTVQPNEVYIIPPKNKVTIFQGKLLLEPADHSKGLQLPIDVFFKSLADDQQERSIAVVLSGTGSDGTRGVRAIKEAGGMVMVQQEETAKFSGMPGSAIATGLADFILAPQEMPAALHNYVRHPYLSRAPVEQQNLLGQESKLDRILSRLRSETRLDFSLYKPSTIQRRIERRMGIAQVVSIEEYLRYLEQSPVELKALCKDLLITVTKFFRDPEAFAMLREKVIPALFKDAEAGKQFRVWVAGCATGEEAYTMAILFADYLEKNRLENEVKIFATDVEREALEYAARGTYPDSIAADLPERDLRRFFSKNGGSLSVNSQVRQMVVFAAHNIISDPPFNKMDLVSCRNMLIYLKPAIQQRVLRSFSFALYPRGYLFLGSSETIGDMADVFETLNVRNKIFRHCGTVKPVLTEGMELLSAQDRSGQRPMELVSGHRRTLSGGGYDGSIDKITEKILTEHVPACLVMETSGLLVHSFGTPGRFLHTPVGRATLNVLDMLPREIALLVSSAMHKVLKTRQPLTYREVVFKQAEGSEVVDLTLEPFQDPGEERTILLLFIEEAVKKSDQDKMPGEHLDLDQTASRRISELELDLQVSKENLQATIEELETSNEELQATNEELLASNEELQSTNEELQSVNEELYTVNAEYQGKITELAELNSDMQNLLISTRIGKIFIDSELRIRKFTPPVTDEIELLAHDQGRSIKSFSHPFLQALVRDAPAVIEQKIVREQLLQSENGSLYLVRLVPYTTYEGISSGAVAAFVKLSASIQEAFKKAFCE